MEDNNYRQITNKWLKELHIKGSVVDIGGGKRTARERLGSCVGEYAVLDRNHYKGLTFKPDIEHDMNIPLTTDKKFDNAFLLFTIEFLWNQVVAFNNISKLLNSGGMLYLNAPYKMPHLVEEDYFRFTDTGLTKVLNETGFEVLSIRFFQGEYDFYLLTARKR